MLYNRGQASGAQGLPGPEPLKTTRTGPVRGLRCRSAMLVSYGAVRDAAWS